MGVFNNICGQRFGRLTVTGKHEKRGHNRYWQCRCDCGSLNWVSSGNLFNGHSQSCGCLNRELAIARNKTHGLSKTPTYKIWKDMRKRCNNSNHKSFHHYGGRGIKICFRWNNYESFYEDMGEKPSTKHSIDRIDNNGNYTPENCRWATRMMQASNTRRTIYITHNGKTKTVSEWADQSPVSYHTFWQRLYRLNWTIDRALST